MRVILAVLIGLLVTAGLVARLGLTGDAPIGAADNADGARLFCVAGLAPQADDGKAAGHGVVVTGFRAGGPPCPAPPPVTSGGEILRAAVGSSGSSGFSLLRLGAVYAGLFGLGAAVAAWAGASGATGSVAAAVSRRRPLVASGAALAVVVPPLLPLLVVPWWSRFLVSTYGEPAGLLGAAWCAWGLLAVALTRPDDRGARVAALGLVGVGGVVAATAKTGYLAVGLVAVAACVLVRVGRAPGLRRAVVGPVVGLVAAGAMAGPVLDGIRFQDELYVVPNTHDLVFTAILPEAGPSPLPALGLPVEAFSRAGEHYYLRLGVDTPGWSEVPGPQTSAIRTAARNYVADHPGVLARMVDRGLVATLAPQVRYLASATGGPGVVAGTREMPSFPEGDQHVGVTLAWFDTFSGRWVPLAVVVVALLGAASTLLPAIRRRLGHVVVGTLRAAGVLATAALGVVVLAVLGDGYVELTKHVWLASYLMVVTGLVLLVAVGGRTLEVVGRFSRVGRPGEVTPVDAGPVVPARPASADGAKGP